MVVGTGISGIGAAKALSLAGARPILYDENETLQKEDIRQKLPKDSHVEIVLGVLQEALLERTELVIVSPGVPADSPLADRIRSHAIEIWGEIELAYQLAKGDVLAITGTNGKTTTTALLGQIMKDCREDVYIVGNIGNPYTSIALDTKDDTVTVAEISSFQLETIHSFKPAVSAVLNITPDHLNRHHTMEAYAAVKESIAGNQDREDTCVLNYEDVYTREMGKRIQAVPFYFSSARALERGIYLEDEVIYLADGTGEPRALLNIHEIHLIGIHNMENVMAAIAMAYRYGAPLSSILTTVKEFSAVEHRIEYVATKRNVDYYNDSKGTNPDAAIKGIQAMQKPTLLIAGGYDKENEYDEWIEAFDGKVKWLILLGQTKEKIAECAKKHDFTNLILTESLEEAVLAGIEKAEPGDAVLLSPACASWGMFPNYEVRGRMFKEYVNQIKE